jgi:hypothetical protein
MGTGPLSTTRDTSIGLAAVGLLNPLLATFIHVASELTFILNSTRLLPPREKNKEFQSGKIPLPS